MERFPTSGIAIRLELGAAVGKTLYKLRTCSEFFAKDTWFRNLIDQARTYSAVLLG